MSRMTMLLMIATDATAPATDWMYRWFRVAQPWEQWWLLLGVAGQLIFFARWVAQWVASERRGESHIPIIFWWCSLLGASMLLIYFIGRREPVGVMGQLFGWVVYGRNLYLIRARRRRINDSMRLDVAEPLPISEEPDGRND
jgi:lipid-A-disaccharide synthase-like uncharacterized protein